MSADKKKKNASKSKAVARKARKADLQKATSAVRRPQNEAPPEKGEIAAAPDDEAAADQGDIAEDRFPIVGIGASAGGLEALEAFFKALPEKTGMAFVVVTHTDPKQTSLLPDIIERQTKIKVVKVEKDVTAAPDTLYMPPSDRDLVIEDDIFRLRNRPAGKKLHLPVDLFMKSLARARGARAACVILSGTGTDGTYGLRAVKERSGLAVVQKPASAKHPGMPESAIDTGLVDILAEPKEMPRRLIDYFAQAVTGPPEVQERPAIERIDPIIAFLARRTRHDFSQYKPATLQRRIGRRIAVTRAGNVSGYRKLLNKDRREANLLFQDLLIGVTNFFRDRDAFDFLKNEVFPDLLAQTEAGDSLRIWIPGCASGEEAYSIAILLHEFLEERESLRELQIFGTDIDSRAVEKARRGEYPTNIAADVSAERLERYFVESAGNRYLVKREIREPIVFAEQDVLRDPPFSDLDLLVCRNLLIYLRGEAQERLLPLFHHVLNKNGFLFLGSAESVGRFTNLFEPRSKKYSVYRKRESTPAPHVSFPTGKIATVPGKENDEEGETAGRDGTGLERTVETILMHEVSQACIVINPNGDVVFTRGRTGKYLELAPGKPNLNIADMAREGLRFPLTAALRKARDSEEWIEQKGLRVKTNGGHQWTNLKAKRFKEDPLKDHLMVIMEAAQAPEAEQPAPGGERREGGGEKRSAALEKELQRLRMEYRSTREELETSNEELRSSNEELQSSNEELQSTNEELESSREELHSLNEELSTVNDELNKKIEELNEAYRAVTEALDSTRIAIVFLDRELRVARFTPAATELIKLIGSDVGRPLEHIADNLTGGKLAKRAARVLDKLEPYEGEIRTEDDHWYRMNILVHRKNDHRIEGVVLTFVNIDAQKAAQRQIAERERRYADSIVATVREGLLILDERLRVVTANTRFYTMFQTDPVETEGRPLTELGHGQWDIPKLGRLLQAVAEDHKTFEDYRVEHDFPGIGRKVMLLNVRLMQEEEEEDKILLAIEDVTDRAGS